VPCSPPRYLEKIGDTFEKALKKEEFFALYPPKLIAFSGIFGKLFNLDKEVKVPNDVCIVCDEVFLVSEVKE